MHFLVRDLNVGHNLMETKLDKVITGEAWARRGQRVAMHRADML